MKWEGEMLYWLIKILSWPFLFLFLPTRVKNRKNIKKGKNYIFVCNHTTNLDVVLLFHNIHRRQYVLAKKELFSSKLKSWFFKRMYAIPVDRQNVDLHTVKTCIGLLKNGKTMTIFPEGTRNKENQDLQAVKNGAAMFAIKSGVEILPIHIAKRPRLFRFNTLTFGEPFSLNQFSGQKLTKEVLDEASKIITDKMNV